MFNPEDISSGSEELVTLYSECVQSKTVLAKNH